MRHLANGAPAGSRRRQRRHLANDYETPSNYSSTNYASANGASSTPSGGRVRVPNNALRWSVSKEYNNCQLLQFIIIITVDVLSAHKLSAKLAGLHLNSPGILRASHLSSSLNVHHLYITCHSLRTKCGQNRDYGMCKDSRASTNHCHK